MYKTPIDYSTRASRQVAYFPECREYVPNPGMGIVSMLLSDHMIDIHTPELSALGSAAFDAAHRLPPHYPSYEDMLAAANYRYTDNLYIRVGWRDVQTVSGKLTISKRFEEALDAVRESGKSWSVRIMQCSPSNPEKSLLPDFLSHLPCLELADEGFPGGGRMLPLYTEDYFRYWSEMCMLFAERFDSDPSLAYVDLSGYGFWGEGHHYGPQMKGVDTGDLYDKSAGDERVARLIDIHEKAFRLTPMAINAHHCEYPSGVSALDRGAWLRRDSYFLWFKPEEAAHGLDRRAGSGVVAETIVPYETRPERGETDGNSFRSFLNLPCLKCDWGCHYGVIGFNPADTLRAAEIYPELFHNFAARIGYRIRPSIVWLTWNDTGKWLTLGMVNDGCVSLPGQLTLNASCNGETSGVTLSEDENYNMCGHMTLIDIPLPENAAGIIKLSASLRMKGKTAPIRFAAESADGTAPYTLTIDI